MKTATCHHIVLTYEFIFNCQLSVAQSIERVMYPSLLLITPQKYYGEFLAVEWKLFKILWHLFKSGWHQYFKYILLPWKSELDKKHISKALNSNKWHENLPSVRKANFLFHVFGIWGLEQLTSDSEKFSDMRLSGPYFCRVIFIRRVYTTISPIFTI